MLSNPKERVGISVSDLGIICHFIAGHAQMLHKQIFPQGHLPQEGKGIRKMSQKMQESVVLI